MLAIPAGKGIRAFGIMAFPAMPFMIGVGPDTSMDAAEEMADANGIAAGGRGWLWSPSYVVDSIEGSSAHLCT